MALPNTYKQVEYIESSGTQYIDTGFITTPNTKVELDFQFTSLVQSNCSFGNTGSGTSNTGATFCWYLGDSATHFKLGIANGTGATDVWNNTVMNCNTNRYVFVAENGKATIYNTAGVEQATKNTVKSISQNCNHSSLLFAAWDPDTNAPSGQCSGKLYSCKIYNSGTLVRDFVPVIRKSDKKPGLYDLVNNQFYTNSGTGEFTYEEYKESGKITYIYLGINQIRPHKSSMDFYYSDDNWNEYQSLVSSIGSVQFVDTGKRYRFNNPCYIGNRTIVNVNGTTFSKINVDTLTVISSKSSTLNGRIWYFGDNRILTRDGIIDFDGNMITSFGTTYRAITPGLPGEVWANDNSYGMYKGIVNGDNITFTKVGTSTSNSGIGASPGLLTYGRLGAYQLGGTENSTHYVGFVNASTGTLSTIAVAAGQEHMSGDGECMPDGKIYKHTCRTLGWGRLYKIGTSGEGAVGNQFGSSWTSWGTRFGKFLGNIVSGGMGTQNGTGNGYGSNNYFINSSGTVTLAQSNAFAYDTNIYSSSGCIDENGWIYPTTGGGGSGVILKTNKTLTDFHWWNPYLWR